MAAKLLSTCCSPALATKLADLKKKTPKLFVHASVDRYSRGVSGPDGDWRKEEMDRCRLEIKDMEKFMDDLTPERALKLIKDDMKVQITEKRARLAGYDAEQKVRKA